MNPDALHDAITAQNSAAIDRLVDDEATFVFQKEDAEFEPFSEKVFQALMNEMRRPEFLRMEGGFVLAMFFEYEWARFTQSQKNAIHALIAETFAQISDWMTCFVYAEILGRFIRGGPALETLLKSLQGGSAFSQSLVLIGLEKLAYWETDSVAAANARASLQTLADTGPAHIRKEALESLRRIANRAEPPDLGKISEI